MSHKVIFGLREGEVVHISDVENGLKCNTICPLCKTKLVAKKGSKNKHHFTHYNSKECKGGFETSMHLAAKEIISNCKEFRIPDVYLNFPNSYKKPELLKKSQMIIVDKVYLEKKIDTVIPDIIIESGGKKLLVEIFVTHRVDENKLKKIKALDISTIEIDLSNWVKNPELDSLRKLIIEESQNKKWLYNKLDNDLYTKFCKSAEPFKPNEYIHAHECPLNNSFYKGVNSIRQVDCVYCEFCLSYVGENNCLGYSKISKVEDLNKKYPQRNLEWQQREKEKKARQKQLDKARKQEEYRTRLRKQVKEDAERKELIRKGYCPQCLKVGLVPGRGNLKDYKICFNFSFCGYKEKISKG